MSHVTWDTGTVLPVARLAALARGVGAWSVIDGAQAVGAIPVTVPQIGADVYAFSGYKWLLGPHGVGGLWRSTRALAAPGSPPNDAPPAVGRGAGPHRRLVGDARGPLLGARAFRPTRRHHGSVAGGDRGRGTADAGPARGDARHVPHRRLASTRRPRGPGPARIRHLRGLEPLDAIRASVAWFNTSAELERFIGAVAELAQATPATLADRPRLVVLPADGAR